MKKYLLYIGLPLIVTGIGFLTSYGMARYIDTDIYGGKEVFWTTEEYTTFKETLAWDSVKDFELTVLQSEKPIIVKLDRVAVKSGSYFPYGERGWLDKNIGAPWTLYAGIPLLTVGIIFMGNSDWVFLGFGIGISIGIIIILT